jgi:DNA (cytosine-5)-methyltransferase 1
MDRPVSTITTQDHHHLVSSHIVKLKGTCRDGQPIDQPLHTVQAGGQHYGEVRAFLMAYYGDDHVQGSSMRDPMRAVRTKDCFALVTVQGQQYAIVDIGMRMLVPRELARATSFRDSYILDPLYQGKRLSKTDQVWMIGNAVPPVMAEALVRANVTEQIEEQAA